MRHEFTLIPLTRGKFAVIDVEDLHLVEGYTWSATKIRGVWYAQSWNPLPVGKMIHMHRTIMGYPEGFLVDHRDFNGLNNRRSNLRLATKTQNQAHSRWKIGKSGYRGVFPVRDGVWKAVISIGNRSKHIGTFSTPEEAAQAYDEHATSLHGEFAVLNFPD